MEKIVWAMLRRFLIPKIPFRKFRLRFNRGLNPTYLESVRWQVEHEFWHFEFASGTLRVVTPVLSSLFRHYDHRPKAPSTQPPGLVIFAISISMNPPRTSNAGPARPPGGGLFCYYRFKFKGEC